MRTAGYYWVRTGEHWFIAEWDGFGFLPTKGGGINERDLTEIDERRIVRELPKLSAEEIAEKTERLRISQERGDRINDIDWVV